MKMLEKCIDRMTDIFTHMNARKHNVELCGSGTNFLSDF